MSYDPPTPAILLVDPYNGFLSEGGRISKRRIAGSGGGPARRAGTRVLGVKDRSSAGHVDMDVRVIVRPDR